MITIVAITVAVVALVAYAWWGLRFLAKVERLERELETAASDRLSIERQKRVVFAQLDRLTNERADPPHVIAQTFRGFDLSAINDPFLRRHLVAARSA